MKGFEKEIKVVTKGGSIKHASTFMVSKISLEWSAEAEPIRLRILGLLGKPEFRFIIAPRRIH